jgi:hypothetical protein
VATDGGFGVVDASSHSAYANCSEDFRFGSGPNRRYVGELGTKPGSIRGETILPGGDSGVIGSPFYGNLLPRWLTNDTYGIRFKRGDVKKAASTKNVFVPAKKPATQPGERRLDRDVRSAIGLLSVPPQGWGVFEGRTQVLNIQSDIRTNLCSPAIFLPLSTDWLTAVDDMPHFRD